MPDSAPSKGQPRLNAQAGGERLESSPAERGLGAVLEASWPRASEPAVCPGVHQGGHKAGREPPREGYKDGEGSRREEV